MSFQRVIEIFPKLDKPTIKLSALGVTSKAFFDWKEKGVIDYKHTYSDEDVQKKVNRKVILLNAFEALWVLIILELRLLNVSLNSLIELKSFLFDQIKTNLEAEEVKALNDDSIKNLIPEEVISELGINMEQILNNVKVYQEASNVFLSNISGLIISILVNGHNPSLMIYKEPSSDENNFYVFNPHAEKFYYETMDQDYRDVVLSKFEAFSIISIPIKPLLAKFFEGDDLNRYSIELGLYTENEIKLLSILKNKTYDKIIISYHREKKDISFEVSSSETITKEKAIELRKILGLKAYEKVEITYRNDKTLFENKIKTYKT